MALVTASRTYDAPKDKVWDVFADIGKVHEIHAKIEASRRENQRQGKGAKRSCDFGKGRGVVEEVTKWKKGETLQFTVTESTKMPMERMVVACAMDYHMKAGWLLNPLARGPNKKAIKLMLEGAEDKLSSKKPA